MSFAQRLEDVQPEKNFYIERIIFTDNYLQTELFYRQMGEKAITDGVIKEVGKELVRKGYSPEMLGQSLKDVMQEESGQPPRKFLSRVTVASTLPLLKKAGILPKGFKNLNAGSSEQSSPEVVNRHYHSIFRRREKRVYCAS